MTADSHFYWRGALVFGSALVYWAGVLIQGRRVRKRIGRQPNLKPRTPRERILWAGWACVVLTWLALPFVVRIDAANLLRCVPGKLLHPLGLAAGGILVVAGYAATLWCYSSMGDAWRIGINQKEKNPLITLGPYARIRHPIYGFQILMLLGVLILLPSLLAAAALTLHWICALAKARDEETYLLGLHGNLYRDYLARTGRLLPKFLQPPHAEP